LSRSCVPSSSAPIRRESARWSGSRRRRRAEPSGSIV
jgi:hypothetical protein